MSKPLLITQTLLSSWQWALDSGEMEEFSSTLLREAIPDNKAMMDGRRFENVLQAVCDGSEILPSHEWYKPIRGLSKILSGSQYQVKMSRPLTLEGIEFVCYGVADFVKAGIIYDTKFSRRYKVGKYLTSPQHPMYFYLCPEAYEFQYLICDGMSCYKEAYRPEDTEPIEDIIRRFLSWMRRTGRMEEYTKNWISKY